MTADFYFVQFLRRFSVRMFLQFLRIFDLYDFHAAFIHVFHIFRKVFQLNAKNVLKT